MLTTSFLLSQNLDGSENVARELFLDMDVDGNEVVTEEEVSQTLEDVLMKFEKKYNHDASSMFLYREWIVELG